MKLEIIANDGRIILRVKEESGKFLDLIMDTHEAQDLVGRIMGAVSHTIEQE